MDQDREEQKHRLHNRDKSDAAKLGWKRNRVSYTLGNRKKERESMNKSFYDICKEMDNIAEAKEGRDDIFEGEYEVTLQNIAGGIAYKINKETGNISFSTTLEQSGSGQYRLLNYDDKTLEELYKNLKADIMELCQNFDDGIQQIIAKHGLNSTK